MLNKLDFFTKSKNFFSFAETLQYKKLGSFRFRIGDYRVIFDFENKSSKIIILLIGHRKNIYR
ncbi:type II toxin-antitoxin system RelE/ParE family toxin [Candidatus Wolfebacteria bacterium]|nr:type II toxin-antitoxin system RelE/ParE family toxin [Candidatus Wolfebacteria bacterium]